MKAIGLGISKRLLSGNFPPIGSSFARSPWKRDFNVEMKSVEEVTNHAKRYEQRLSDHPNILANDLWKIFDIINPEEINEKTSYRSYELTHGMDY